MRNFVISGNVEMVFEKHITAENMEDAKKIASDLQSYNLSIIDLNGWTGDVIVEEVRENG